MARFRALIEASDDEFVPELEDLLQKCRGMALDATPRKSRTSPRKPATVRPRMVVKDTEDEDSSLSDVLAEPVEAYCAAPDNATKRQRPLQRPLGTPSLTHTSLFTHVKLLADLGDDTEDASPRRKKLQGSVMRARAKRPAEAVRKVEDRNEAPIVIPSSLIAPSPYIKSTTETTRYISSVEVIRCPQTTAVRPTSSSDNDQRAILSYDPPRRRSPHKIVPPLPPSRPRTPSPPSSPSKSKLRSPTKLKASSIPPTPHRPSIDPFWSQDVVNQWTDTYSPKKMLTTPKANRWMAIEEEDCFSDEAFPSPTTSPRKSPTKPPMSPTKSPTKKDRAAIEARKAFDLSKEAKATAFLAELDEKITDGALARLSAATGGVKIIWSKKLNSTAGRASWKRERIPPRPLTTDTQDSKQYIHHASIELASKIIDTDHRLLNTLAHEFCHLANYMVSGIKDHPHGKEFKAWGEKVSCTFRDKDIVVTTKHTYEIEYKYIWECAECGHEYKRHSKSLDTAKHSCGACKGNLVQVKPVPRGNAGKVTDYQAFVKGNFQAVKAGRPGAGHGVVMEVLGKMYREQKAIDSAKSLEGVELLSVDSVDVADEVDDIVDLLEVVVIDD